MRPESRAGRWAGSLGDPGEKAERVGAGVRGGSSVSGFRKGPSRIVHYT
jgi:hypothetical protein